MSFVSKGLSTVKIIYQHLFVIKKDMVLANSTKVEPKQSFYSLSAIDMSGKKVSFEQYHGKKVLLVNVASFCGYTKQYEGLEKLYNDNKGQLVILGFPANNFGEQEPGNNEDISKFCAVNYGVTFPVFKKSSVLSPDQNEVYQWLSQASKNGWCNQAPVWNFCKYMVNENGRLERFFAMGIAPDSQHLLEALK